MSQDALIEPIDVLAFRGNRLFGQPGSWGEAAMPPPVSAVAGALRSAALARDAVDFDAFAGGRARHPAVGDRDNPGPFALADLALAKVGADGAVQPLRPMPADLIAFRGSGRGLEVAPLRPTPPPPAMRSNLELPLWATLSRTGAAKPVGGLFMTAVGWTRWLAGELPDPDHLVSREALWATERRVGIGLDADRRAAADQKLFSSDVITLQPDVALAVRVDGLDLAEQVLRLGGDGHAAICRPCTTRWPTADLGTIARMRRARIILTSPGLFSSGWLPEGAQTTRRPDGIHFELAGVTGRIVCAALGRAAVVSGFDLAQRCPKPAQRVVPAGAVYWLDDLQASAEQLGKLAASGLWGSPHQNAPRAAEGYNRFCWAAWPQH